MTAPVIHIANHRVPVLSGAEKVLCAERELRNKYCTNRAIKTWATYFLLKSLTTSGVIQNWQAQKNLLAFLHMSRNTFKARLDEMEALKLCTCEGIVRPSGKLVGERIVLTSYEKAADILDIPFEGTTDIYYNEKLPGNQIFQYYLRAAEIAGNQIRQLEALNYYLEKNPLIREQLFALLVQQMGADGFRLQQSGLYVQQQLLLLQKKAFREGSEVADIINAFRADINRCAATIRDHHCYKSIVSVGYMKRKLQKLQLVSIGKETIESQCRARLYITDRATGAKRDGYRWLKRQKATAWQLTDQVNVKIRIDGPKKEKKRQAAA